MRWVALVSKFSRAAASPTATFSFFLFWGFSCSLFLRFPHESLPLVGLSFQMLVRVTAIVDQCRWQSPSCLAWNVFLRNLRVLQWRFQSLTCEVVSECATRGLAVDFGVLGKQFCKHALVALFKIIIVIFVKNYHYEMIKAARAVRKRFIWNGQTKSIFFIENRQFSPNSPPPFFYEIIKAARAAQKFLYKKSRPNSIFSFENPQF